MTEQKVALARRNARTCSGRFFVAIPCMVKQNSLPGLRRGIYCHDNARVLMDQVHTKDLHTNPCTAGETLRRWLAVHDHVFVLTGAGCSTGSGIPDYRDRNGQWKRSPPVTIQAFVHDPAVYRRYWARSCVGWPQIAHAKPNDTHHALARLQRENRLSVLVTQNVDGLHQRAGSHDVIDLHGRIDAVICMGCETVSPRDQVQGLMEAANPAWRWLKGRIAPDGDAEIEHGRVGSFVPPRCDRCGGMLKPHVVFFGENVPRARVEAASDALASSSAMLVVGSSLMVYSGFRFARIANESGIPVAILNRGRTRADALADLKLDADAGPTLLDAI